MTKIGAALLSATILSLGACGQPASNDVPVAQNEQSSVESENGCLSKTGREIAIGAITKQVIKQVSTDAPTSAEQQIPAAVVRNSVESIEMEIVDVRTTAQDDKTTKKSCTGMFSVKLPVSVTAKANESLSITDSTTIEDLAMRYDMEAEGPSYQIAMDYSIQPTDDGQKIYAEVSDTQNIVAFLTRIVVSDVYSGRIRLAKQDQDKRELTMKVEQEKASMARDQSNLIEATERRRLSITRINTAWDSMPQTAQDRLLVLQRAWNKRRTAECQLQASNSASGSEQALTARYACESVANNGRAELFEQIAQRAASSGSE